MRLIGYCHLPSDSGKAQVQQRLVELSRVAGATLESVIFEESEGVEVLLQLIDTLQPEDAVILSKVHDIARLDQKLLDKVSESLTKRQAALAAADLLESVISLRNDKRSRYLTSQVLLSMVDRNTTRKSD